MLTARGRDEKLPLFFVQQIMQCARSWLICLVSLIPLPCEAQISFLDLTPGPPPDGMPVVREGFGGRFGPPLDASIKITELDDRPYLLFETFTFEVTITNTGRHPIIIPWTMARPVGTSPESGYEAILG